MKPALDRMIADGNETAVAEELLPGMIGDDTLSGLAKDGAGHADECLEFWETEHTRPEYPGAFALGESAAGQNEHETAGRAQHEAPRSRLRRMPG